MAYEITDSETVYDGQLSRVVVHEVRMPDGVVAAREVVEHPDAVAVVPLDEQDRVVLVRQYRVPVGDYVLEIPAGKLDVAGEDEEACARRELLEEVGLTAADLRRLLRFANSGGWTDETTTIFLATGLSAARAPEGFTPEAEEADLEVRRVPLAEAVAMACRGELSDAKTLIGLLLVAQLRAGQTGAAGDATGALG